MEDERVALVSGGNRGIGLEVCRQLSERGITVLIGSRDEDRGRAAAEGLEGNVVPHQLDVADAGSVYGMAAFLEEEFGRLDVLVNNAAISNDEGQRGVDADLDRVKKSLEANLFGAWRLCEMAVPLMRRNGYGRIVNVSSGQGQLSEMGAGTPAYRVSKTALNALTRTLAAEFRGSGILVNSMCPGWVKTDMGGAGAAISVEESAKGITDTVAGIGIDKTGIFVNYDGKTLPW